MSSAHRVTEAPGGASAVRSRRRRPGIWASFVVIAFTLLANALWLLRIRSNNPILYSSGLGSPAGGWIKGGHTIDPNDGWTAQALGRLAAESWAHGHVPLWNVYEGFGQPLAGEMQSAAFFLPFVLFQLLPNGVFLMHLALELVAGLSTLAFLRSLRLSWVASTAGAVLFAVNGSFAVMTNAPFNPLAFLPMALWGIELVRRETAAGRRPRWGVCVTALSIAWMLFAGFPESAFLEGLFVGCWFVLRMAQAKTGRLRFAGWVMAAGAAGLALAAPILLAFVRFLGFGTTAYHEDIANNLSYPLHQVASLGMPFLTGGLGNHVFGLQAGYITVPALLVALIGCFGSRERGVRLLLAGSFIVLVANMFGFPPVKFVLNHTPGFASVLGYKYGLVLIELIVAILVGFGVEDLRRSRVRGRQLTMAAALTALYVLGCLTYLSRRGFITNVRWTALVAGATVIACLVLVLLFRAPLRRQAGAAVLAVAVLGLDAGAAYAVPQLGASGRGPVDTSPVAYLQKHLGTDRFYTLGPIQPDYGSYWQLAQLNVNDLPVPEKFSKHLTDKLSPRPGTPGARGTAKSFKPFQLVPFNPNRAQEKNLLMAYGQQQQYFRDAGVRFVVMRPGVGKAGHASKYGLTKVFSSRKTEIWRDDRARPYYETSGAPCTIKRQSLDGLTITCAKPATLQRRQLASPDWRATINGHDHAVENPQNALFQRVSLPAGTSHVSFAYQPKHFPAAVALSLLVALILCGDAVVGGLRRGKRHGGARPNGATPQT